VRWAVEPIPCDAYVSAHGEEGKGFRYILSGMNAERMLIAAECVGDAKWFIAKASNYAKERSVFGRPIGQNRAFSSRSQRPMRRCGRLS
jgi:alkylation response protein AidB-like acyl-CoA dehydrogenase